jgi:phage terminase large subunit
MERPHRILCARELQVSIKDSVHKLLADQIDLLGLPYDVQQTSIRCPATGTEYLFKGLRHNAQEIKSTEGVTIAWVEEAQAVSNASWQLLIPTIREAGSEIWVSFNPDLETDPTYQRFIKKPPPNTITLKVGWEDNPWMTPELLSEKDYLYSIDPEAAEHVWGGQCRKFSAAQIFAGRYVIEPFAVDPSWDGPYHGVDWGFSTDPSVMVRVYYDKPNRTVYIAEEAWGLQVETEDLGALFRLHVPGAERYVVRADSARPETISYVRRGGPTATNPYPRMIGCEKWPGCVEDGIAWLRSQRIVISPKCPKTAEEARLYSHATTTTGEVLPDIVDKHNHCWDAIRYALEPLIRNQGTGYAASRG